MGRTVRNRKRMFDDDDFYSDNSKISKKKHKISEERRKRKNRHENYEYSNVNEHVPDYFDDGDYD